MKPSWIETQQLVCAHRLLDHVRQVLDFPVSVRLWDGSVAPLGREPHKDIRLVIEGPRTVTTLVRQPTLENLLRHYAVGKIGFEGTDHLSFIRHIRQHNPKKRLKQLNKWLLFSQALPFLFGPSEKPALQHDFKKKETGTKQSERNNSDYIQFHYDAGNGF